MGVAKRLPADAANPCLLCCRNNQFGGRPESSRPRRIAAHYFYISDADVRHLPGMGEAAGESAN